MTEKAKKFLDAYKAKYNEEPSMFSALAYDSVYMVAEAAKGAKTSVDIKDNLAKLKDFEGVTGSITMDKDHNPVKSALMLGLKDGKVATVETVKP
jgi:branched-chain amino acid transporter